MKSSGVIVRKTLQLGSATRARTVTVDNESLIATFFTSDGYISLMQKCMPVY